MTQLKGLDELLAYLKAHPQDQRAKSRYFVLASELTDKDLKAHYLLSLARQLLKEDPLHVLALARSVFFEQRENQEALEVARDCLLALGLSEKAAVVTEELDFLRGARAIENPSLLAQTLAPPSPVSAPIEATRIVTPAAPPSPAVLPPQTDELVFSLGDETPPSP